ncbi:hypothetical protein E2320_006971, partial [Naja naja]
MKYGNQQEITVNHNRDRSAACIGSYSTVNKVSHCAIRMTAYDSSPFNQPATGGFQSLKE